MARSNKAPKQISIKIGGVPCVMVRKPGTAYAAMLKGGEYKLGKMSSDHVMEREAAWAAGEVQRLAGLTIDCNYSEALKAWHYRAVSAYYSAMTKLGKPVTAAPVVDQSEPDMFEVDVVEDEAEPDLVEIRRARALEMDEAVDAAAEAAPLDRPCGFAEFVEACEAEDDRPVREFGAIEPVVEDEPAVREAPALEVVPNDPAELREWLAARPGAEPRIERTFLHVSILREAHEARKAEREARRAASIPPANMVPVEPFRPRPQRWIDLADAFRARYGNAA